MMYKHKTPKRTPILSTAERVAQLNRAELIGDLKVLAQVLVIGVIAVILGSYLYHLSAVGA